MPLPLTQPSLPGSLPTPWKGHSRPRDPPAAVIATLTGEVVQGRFLVSGGGKDEGGAILGIKREVKDLRDRIAGEEAERDQSVSEVAALEARIAQVSNALAAVTADLHREEKAILSLEMQLQRSADDLQKVQKKAELLEIERRGAEEQRRGAEARQREARDAIVRLEQEQQLRGREAFSRAASPRRRKGCAAGSCPQRRRNESGVCERSWSEPAAISAEVARLEESNTELESAPRGRAGQRCRDREQAGRSEAARRRNAAVGR